MQKIWSINLLYQLSLIWSKRIKKGLRWASMGKAMDKMSFRIIEINLLHKVNIKKTSISLSLRIKKAIILKMIWLKRINKSLRRASMNNNLNKISFRIIKINLLHKVNIKKTSISLSLRIKKAFIFKNTSKNKANNKLIFRIIKTKIFHNLSNQFLIIKIKNYFLILQKALLKNMKPIHML